MTPGGHNKKGEVCRTIKGKLLDGEKGSGFQEPGPLKFVDNVE